MKRFVYILGILFLFLSCDDKNFYKIEGKLSNLNDATLYVVFESPETIRIDTVMSNEKGQFSVFHEQSEEIEFQSITIYYHNREQWFIIYPEAGKTVKVKGDARYPQTLQIKGGRINDKLSQYKKKVAPLLKDLSDIHRNNRENIALNDRDAMLLPTLNHEIQKTREDYITKNPGEKASAVLIAEYFADLGEIEQTESLLQMLSPELYDYFIVKNIRDEIEKVKTTQVGAKAPDFQVTNIYGQSYSIDSFANKYFILAFTALWCDLCKTQVLMLDDITSKYSTDSLEILLISLDDELDDIREMIRQDTIQWNLVADSAGQAIQLFDVYNVNSLPKCFLIDKDGIILLNTKNGEELKQTIEEVMK